MSNDTQVLENLIKNLRMDIKNDVQDTINSLEAKITSNVQQLHDKIDEKFSSIQINIDELKETTSLQNKRLCLLEKQARIRNLIFFGTTEGEKSYEELETKITTLLSRTLKIECNKNEIEFIRRMGKKEEGKIRPIIVTFTTFGKKLHILKTKKLLKDSGMYIKEDFPPEILETRKKLQEQVNKERSEGKIAFIKYDKIVIKGNTKNSPPKIPQNILSSKKRELDISPPTQTPENLQQPGKKHLPKYQAAKKNKTQNENQRSILKFVQKQNDQQKVRSISTTSVDESDAE